jgi:hypothetical protein
MATKTSAAGSKRKGAPTGKGGGFGSQSKKARVETGKKAADSSAESMDEFESMSDSEDGGVKLDQSPQIASSGKSKPAGAGKGRTFERGIVATLEKLAVVPF